MIVVILVILYKCAQMLFTKIKFKIRNLVFKIIKKRCLRAFMTVFAKKWRVLPLQLKSLKLQELITRCARLPKKEGRR